MTERVLFTDICSDDKGAGAARREFMVVDEGEFGAIESDPNNDIWVAFEDYPTVQFPPAAESLPASAEVEDTDAATVITLNALGVAKIAYSRGKSSGDVINILGVE